jgi:hypothetical protein
LRVAAAAALALLVPTGLVVAAEMEELEPLIQ